MTMNFERARFNMVEQQVRPWEVLDARVLSLFERIHREDFVPVRYRKFAFSDLSIPLDHDQVMMRPNVEGRMLQALELDEDETVLEIGTGSGFITACLAHLAKQVVSVDLFENFTQAASRTLSEKDISNVELFTGDVMRGWQPEQAHDVVVVTGSVPVVPENFQGWVTPPPCPRLIHTTHHFITVQHINNTVLQYIIFFDTLINLIQPLLHKTLIFKDTVYYNLYLLDTL